jgi:phosphate transport system permease protein
MTRFERRLLRDRIMKIIATALAGIALVFLFWILWTLVSRGASALSTTVFTRPMSAPGGGGGLSNAILGTLMQVIIGLVISTPIGVMTGTYLSEAKSDSKTAGAVRFINDVLLSAPSILIGLFVYSLLVRPFGGFSGWAGAVALAIVILPVVVRATEDMLRLVPVSLREAAFALGAPHYKVVVSVMWRAARGGILTGILLAVARAAGETAPLLFTSLGNSGWSFNLTQPMSSLPVTINQYAGSPAQDWVALAWAGSLIITVGVLVINIISRLAFATKRI